MCFSSNVTSSPCKRKVEGELRVQYPLGVCVCTNKTISGKMSRTQTKKSKSWQVRPYIHNTPIDKKNNKKINK